MDRSCALDGCAGHWPISKKKRNTSPPTIPPPQEEVWQQNSPLWTASLVIQL